MLLMTGYATQKELAESIFLPAEFPTLKLPAGLTIWLTGFPTLNLLAGYTILPSGFVTLKLPAALTFFWQVFKPLK